MKKLWLLAPIPIIFLLWWALGTRDAVPQIHFAQVRRAELQSTVSTNGKIEPAKWAAARAETTGVVRTVSVQQGEAVSAGQALITMDASSAYAELASAQARTQAAKGEDATLAQGGRAATVAQFDDQIKAAQATVGIAQRRYESFQRLLPQQAATKMQVDDARDSLAQAQAQLTQLQDQRRVLVTQTDRVVTKARLQDAEAALSVAQKRLGWTVVRSPLAGTLYQFDIRVGAYLQPGELVGLVGQLDQVKVVVYVDEPDLGRVRRGLPVAITWEARAGQIWQGRVEKLPTQIVALGTRNVGEVTTIVDNPDHDLLPGVTVYATIVAAQVRNALTIPKGALRTVAGQTGVYKLAERTVAWTPVKVGISDVHSVQILSGLNQNDRVALPSEGDIHDAAKVKPVLD